MRTFVQKSEKSQKPAAANLVQSREVVPYFESDKKKEIDGASCPIAQMLKPILQKKSSCACGGSCPRCIAKNNSANLKTKSSSPSGLQGKLTVGKVNDPLEQEADRVADQVIAGPTHSAVSNTPPRIQRSTQQAAEGLNTAPASVDNVLASSGKPLEPTLQQDMGQRFDHDFSQVRVHSGAAAEQSARDVSANAYTVGNNVVFGAGQFAPQTQSGRRLIAHELTHVIQRGDGVQRSPTLLQRDYNGEGVDNPSSSPEQLDDKPKKVCGPDITKQLKDAQLKTRKQFGTWKTSRKESACQSLVSLVLGSIAWDIIELNESDWILKNYGPTCASEGATPSCIKSVQVNDQCFYAGSVNYVHFGNMFDLCQAHYASAYPLNKQFTQNEMLKWIDNWKGKGFSGLSTPSDNFQSSVDWASAGFFNWPHGALTPKGDRPNCSPTCALPYVGGNFTVNWDGENF